MKPATMKRACDCCIRRKVRCDGFQPCRKCRDASPSLNCTYLKPIQKRGPKVPRVRAASHDYSEYPQQREGQDGEENSGVNGYTPSRQPSRTPSSKHSTSPPRSPTVCYAPNRVHSSILRMVIEVYRSRMYPVWPVIDDAECPRTGI